MTRFIGIILIGGLFLLGGILFLVFRDDTSEETTNVFSEGASEESMTEAGEGLAVVFEDMPKQPDFASITETIFLSEGVEEAKSFEVRAIVPLENLKRVAMDAKLLLEKKEVNWCGPLAISSEERLGNDRYRETLQEEREIRDVTFLPQVAQAGEEWNDWLVRLMEAASREGKKAEKVAEKFQETFNEITDEHEETLYQAAVGTREKIDTIIFVEQDVLLLPSNLVQELNKNLETEIRDCQEGKALMASEQETVSRALINWEARVKNALEGRKRIMNRVLDVPTASLPTLKPKIQDYTARFEAAVVELQQINR